MGTLIIVSCHPCPSLVTSPDCWFKHPVFWFGIPILVVSATTHEQDTCQGCQGIYNCRWHDPKLINSSFCPSIYQSIDPSIYLSIYLDGLYMYKFPLFIGSIYAIHPSAHVEVHQLQPLRRQPKESDRVMSITTLLLYIYIYTYMLL